MTDGEQAILALSLDIHNIAEGVSFGLHGFIGEETDTKFPTIKSRIVTNEGYQTMKQHLDTESRLMIPTMYLDIYGISEQGNDDASNIIKTVMKVLTKLKEEGIDRGIIYHADTILNTGIRNKNTKRLRNNKDDWSKLYKLMDKLNFTYQFIIDLDAKPSKLGKNTFIKAQSIMDRADDILGLNITDSDVPFDILSMVKSDDVANYWKQKVDINPLLAFKELLYYQQCDFADGYAIVNRGKDFINIGRKSEHAAYGYVKLTVHDEDIDNMRALMQSVVPDKSNILTLRLETLKIQPGLILRDLYRFGKPALHLDREVNVVKTMHNKIMGNYTVTPAMTLNGINFIKHLSNVLECHLNGKGDNNYTLVDSLDITNNFITHDDKGKVIVTESFKNAKSDMIIPLKNKRKLRMLLGVQVLDKNSINKLIRRDFNIKLIWFKVTGDEITRMAYVISTCDGVGIYNNWYMMVSL